MKKTSRIFTLGIVSIVVISAIIIFYNKENKVNDKVKYINSSAKVISYSDFNDLDNSTKLIIRGTKDHIEDTVIERDNMGDVIGYYTNSIIEVNKVYKSDNPNIIEGSKIKIQENGATESTKKGTIVYGIEGYQLMNKQEEYLLFLSESTTDSDIYFVQGVYYGKIPLKESNKNNIQNLNESNSLDFQYEGEVRKGLKQIFKDAINKYGNEN